MNGENIINYFLNVKDFSLLSRGERESFLPNLLRWGILGYQKNLLNTKTNSVNGQRIEGSCS